MDTATRYDVAPEQKFVAPGEVGYGATRFPDEQHPGSHVPRLEVVLIERVEPAAGYVSQINRGRPHPAQTVGLLHQRLQNVQVAAHLSEGIIRETRSDQAFAQVIAGDT